MTNYEKIKAMTIEEMGKQFDDDCIACTKHWLESEAGE